MAIFAMLLVACDKTNREEEVPVASISLRPTYAELILGESLSLTAKVEPENATDKKIVWESSTPAVVSVTQNGVVTAESLGEVTITARAGGKAATSMIKVIQRVVPVTSLTLDHASLEMIEGDEATLVATVAPDNATDKTVTWSSSNEQVATVAGGKVKALKEGSATITAKAGEKTATCAVTVSKKYIAVESVTLNKSTLSLIKGTYETLTASVTPEDATEQTPAWVSSNEEVATVDAMGRVTGRGGGSCTVSATVGGKSASCEVTVTVPVTAVSLNITALTLVEGESEVLTATIVPEDATDKTVTWTSSDERILTVENGRVTALKEGAAIVTAKAGGKSATCTVTVQKKVIPVSGITLDKTELTLVEGASATLTATVLPENATDKSVTWKSSNEVVAVVTSAGLVMALTPGSAVITARAGDQTATCALVVEKKVVAVTGITLNKSSLSLTKGSSETLMATVTPYNATDKTVTWSSDNPAIATVDETGKVTAVGGGSAVITAQAGDQTATCAVTVTVPVISVSLNKGSLTLVEGESETLTVTVNPTDATNQQITWSSSSSSVASVVDGVVTALAPGTAVITARVADKEATCVVQVERSVIPVTGISLNKTSLNLIKGNSETLTATVTPADATDKTITWSTSNETIAKVDGNGRVTAVGGGSAVITAKAGDQTATCAVTVTVPVSGIALNKSSLSLTKGASEILIATVTPSDATDKTVSWSSSNAAVAAVDANGKVTAVGGGSAVITAKAGEQTATCAVTVTVPVSSVTLNKSSLVLVEGDAETLIATVNPSDATDKTVTWSSSNLAVATVDASGKVTALKEGTAIITAQASGKTATCAVTVSNRVIPVSSISLNKSSLSLQKGEGETLTATVSPSDATDPTVTWSSSNPAVASVSAEGYVKAEGGGSAIITARAGNKTAVCSVSVTVPVSSVTLNKSTLSLQKGDGESLVATVNPSDATDKTVTWSSSNPAVATVSAYGFVIAVSSGTAVITAKAGNQTATCAVTVTIPVSSISLNKTILSLKKGEGETLVATVNPSDATDKTVTWSSSNPAVATVSAEGYVEAVGGGSATITAKAGDRTAVCSVTVSVPVSSITLNKSNLALNKGDGETLTATVNPFDATDKTITWSSSNAGVATVNAQGYVKAVSGGSAVITAKAGDQTATCLVTVTVPVQSITLNKSNLSLNKGEGATLTATVNPYDATDKAVTWSSSNPAVATVSEQGYVKAVGGGSATITARAGEKTATCAVTVTVPVTSLTLNKSTLTLLEGSSETLTASVNPSDATYPLIWTSSDVAVATVDANGKVTAVRNGSATITVKAGDKTATCAVTVQAPGTGGGSGGSEDFGNEEEDW